MTEVLKVKPWGKDQGDFVLINAEDFNHDFHELLDAALPAADGDSEAQARVDALKAALTEKGIKFRSNATEAKLKELIDAAASAA